ncbi:MAG: hypothetical protein Q8O67_01815 [Deltaproteobacteria bacterium]|nr:hypothetical protein [Deltaproteobacteria bacterium]
MRSLGRLLVVSLVLVTAALQACDPVLMPHQMPGPNGCGKRDPSEAGPSTMSVAQNTVLKNQGQPGHTELNELGGRDWTFVRQAGSVFGETETAEVFTFNAQGLLVSQRTEVRKQHGK